MANLLAEGLGGLALGTSQVGSRFSATPGVTITNTSTPVPPNGYAARSTNNAGTSTEAARFNVPTITSGFWGQRCLPMDTGQSVSGVYILVAFHDATGARNFYVNINSAGRLEVRNNANTVLGTGTSAFSLVNWFYLEVSFTMSATVGAVEVKVTQNGVVTTEMTLTGINNAPNAANVGAITPVWIRGDGAGGIASPATTDYYLNDNTGGGANATYWGDTRYLYVVPTGAGASTQFTPSAGSNWAAVDELPGHNTDTDYVENATVTNRDLYACAALASTATVIRDVKQICTARAPNGSANLKLDIRHSTTVSAGASQALSTGSYAEIYRSLGAINPVTTAAWTLSDLNALQIGQEVS